MTFAKHGEKKRRQKRLVKDRFFPQIFKKSCVFQSTMALDPPFDVENTGFHDLRFSKMLSFPIKNQNEFIKTPMDPCVELRGPG